MRSSLALLAFISLPVLACPNLAGTYKSCQTSGAEGTSVAQIVIEQKIINNVTQFTFTTSEIETNEDRIEKYTADGKLKVSTETDQDSGVTIRTSTTTSCVGDVLKIKMNAKMDSEEFANITIQTLKVGNQLKQTFSGISLGETVSETVICE
jgi:hypothetical protein